MATNELITTTYSSWAMFRNCRRKYLHRYIEEIAPVASDAQALRFGALIHNALEAWHGCKGSLVDAGINMQITIEKECSGHQFNPDLHAQWHLAHAMMDGYSARYADEDRENFSVVSLERQFVGPIINPETGARSLTFQLAGKVDGVVRDKDTGHLWLLEHKTAALIDGAYLEKLWTDMQIHLYAMYMEKELGEPIAGVVYNILTKCRKRQRVEESEADYQARYEALCAKNKNGKSSAKRHLAESDENFRARLAEYYAQPETFHRERIYIDRGQVDELRAELWELTQAYLDARRLGQWYRNTSQCFNYGRPCPYYPLCSSSDNPNVRDNLYEHRPVNEELSGASSVFDFATQTDGQGDLPF